MANFTQVEPQQGRAIVHEALRRRLHGTPAVPMSLGIAQTGTPIPVYRLTRRGAAKAEPLSSVRKVGWRYPVLIAETSHLAYVRESSHGLQFGGMGEGILPQRLFEAAGLVERELQAVEESFQPRLLEIPSLRLYALWLYAPRGASRFVRLIDGFGANGALQIEKDIVPHIRARLVQTNMKHPQPRPRVRR